MTEKKDMLPTAAPISEKKQLLSLKATRLRPLVLLIIAILR